ncbi:MAG: anaerobic ribonucleoside-triphosphate reductase activating protein [Treponema sp.]|nr:anaerobic ribonucleoside-triphosphate reductase activating protein [Treponema sp.]
MSDLNKPAGVLVKTTLVDFPGHVASALFLKGCNLRCPYCYNTGLVFNNEPEDNLSSVNQLFEHLEKRRHVIDGLAISGGEPLVSPYTKIIIQKAKELGYKVKMDTNGLLTDRLYEIISSPSLCPDFIAMDIKTSPLRYAETMFSKPLINEKENIANNLKKSAELIGTLPKENREFRTVLVPGLVDEEDIRNIAKIIPQDASWQFAQFRNDNCLDPSYNNIPPYLDAKINHLIEYAKTLIPDAALR